jgi:hypothetical protein
MTSIGRTGSTDCARRPRKIRYTDVEWAKILTRARACGRPPARYVRETSLGIVPRVRRGHSHADLIHELGQIGTTLVRIASMPGLTNPEQRAHASVALDTALAELLAAVRRIG